MEKNMLNSRKRRHGDRYDGYRVYSKDPFFTLVPHIMTARHDSQVHFEIRVEIAELEKFCRKLRKETEMHDLSLLHLFMAAVVRMYSQRPQLNRFIAGRKTFARNEICLGLVLKKELTLEAEEIFIKPVFQPDADLHDVWKTLSETISENKAGTADNGTDSIAKLLSKIPTWLLKMVVGFLKGMDNIGWMPKSLNRFSPFHCSLFLTDMGSTGIGAVYHHLYDFGTCSVFACLGKKESVLKRSDDGSVGEVKTVNLRFVVDERICDGYYYATAIRNLRRLLLKPELLLQKPEKVETDTGVGLFDKKKKK